MAAATRAPVPIPPIWTGRTAVIVGTGPSFRPDDVSPYVHSPVIAINDALFAVPWAAVHYAPDAKWWKWHGAQAIAYPAIKYTLDAQVAAQYDTVGLLKFRSGGGISDDPSLLHTGGHSGIAAINLAAHHAPSSIILLGYDLSPDESGQHHFFGDHPDGSHVRYDIWRDLYSTLLEPLHARGIQIFNASRQTTITAIPRL